MGRQKKQNETCIKNAEKARRARMLGAPNLALSSVRSNTPVMPDEN
jgi:hypothetical protein